MPVAGKSTAHRPMQAPKKRTVSDEDEARLQEAKVDYDARRYPSIKAAADAHNVKYFTLRRRIQGSALPKKKAHENQQLLTNAEQKTLVDWVQ